MPEFVVEPFEVVDIDHDDRHSRHKARGTLQLFGNAHFKVPAIEDPGKAVHIGQLLHAVKIVGVLDGRRANIGD